MSECPPLPASIPSFGPLPSLSSAGKLCDLLGLCAVPPLSSLYTRPFLQACIQPAHRSRAAKGWAWWGEEPQAEDLGYSHAIGINMEPRSLFVCLFK